jgi:cell division protein FtsB
MLQTLNHPSDLVLLAQSYWGMHTEQAKQLKGLERDNRRLKQLVGNLSSDPAILKETARDTNQPGETLGQVVQLLRASERRACRTLEIPRRSWTFRLY